LYLNVTKYNLKYIDQNKLDFKHETVCEGKLTLDMSKYETVCQKKVDFGYAQI
jgi:hypothetical protein